MSALDRLKIILPIPRPNDHILNEYLKQTEDLILNYTNRKTMPDGLVSLQINLTMYAINKIGAEGESERKEGDVQITFLDVPPSAIAQMNNFRIGRVPRAFAKET